MLFGSYLEDAGSVWRPPGVEEIVFAGRNEPFATRSELERQNAGLVQVQLVFVRLGVVQHLHVTALHSGKERGKMMIFLH